MLTSQLVGTKIATYTWICHGGGDLELLLSDYIKMGIPPIFSHCCSTTMTINHCIELVPSAVHRAGCAEAASSRLQLTAAKGAQVPLRIITTCAQRSGGKFSNLFSGTARDAQAIRFFFLLLYLAPALRLSSTELTSGGLGPGVRSESQKTSLRLFALEICES